MEDKTEQMDKISILLTSDKLDVQSCYSFVEDPSTGGISLFVGTVRNSTKDRDVQYLDFSGYQTMAFKEMNAIAQKALEKFPIAKIAIHHVLGKLEIGEIPVIIAVSSAHRKAAFEACQFAIDSLKNTVPIWKKEFFEDGEVWVNAHP